MSRLEQLQAFLKESPDDPFILFALAKEYEKQGDDDHTKQYFLQLTREHPKYVGTYYHLGKWYERQNAVEDALKTYEKGMTVARQQGDQHALGELAAAKLNIADE